MNVNELFNLKGKVALITGGNKGLGKIMGESLAECGANIVIVGRNEELNDKVAKEITDLGVEAIGIKCDVTQKDQVKSMVDEVMSKFGKIDILINNAGMSWTGSPETLELKDWQKVMDLNITGTFIVSQEVGKIMIKQKLGRIINVASVAGMTGINPEIMNNIAYNTSKAAVVNFTRDLSCKWISHNINVIGFAPGYFYSDMSQTLVKYLGDKIFDVIPMKRFGTQDELKGTIAYLASPAGGYISGSTLVVDGGMLSFIG